LKTAFAAILLYFLYRQVFHNNDLEQSWKHFLGNFRSGTLSWLYACFLFMPLNWLFESQKWKLLVQPFEKISFLTSLKAILSGISIAILTPNRMGEYGGRMVMVEAKNNWKAVISTLVSSYAQNIWNIGLGLLATFLFLHASGKIDAYIYNSGLVLAFVFLIMIILLYFNIDLISRLLSRFSRFKIIKKSLKHLTLLSTYEYQTLSKVLTLALVRYMIYVLQYIFILKFFGLEISYVNAAIGIATIFLVQTSLPLPPIIGFLARGEIALLVWEAYQFNELSILASSYLLWLINLILPSIVGAIVIFSSNLSRTFGLHRNYFK